MKRLLFLAPILSAAMPAYAAVPPIKVMSFNIRFDDAAGVPSDQENAWLATSEANRRDLVLQVIGDYAPDLLGVQEALKNQMADIQSRLTSHTCYGPGRDDGAGKGEHCGIFYRSSRFTKQEQGTFWLNSTPDQPGSKFPKTCCARIASWVIVRDKLNHNLEYLVLNTHWDHQVQAARRFSAQLIGEFMKSNADQRPIILVGDLNVAADNPAYLQLVSPRGPKDLRLFDSYSEKPPSQGESEGTYHGFRGITNGARIDYVLYSKAFRPLAAQIVRYREDQQYPSDHYPVTATLVPLDR